MTTMTTMTLVDDLNSDFDNRVWTVAEAKAKLSEVMKKAERIGPPDYHSKWADRGGGSLGNGMGA